MEEDESQKGGVSVASLRPNSAKVPVSGGSRLWEADSASILSNETKTSSSTQPSDSQFLVASSLLTGSNASTAFSSIMPKPNESELPEFTEPKEVRAKVVVWLAFTSSLITTSIYSLATTPIYTSFSETNLFIFAILFFLLHRMTYRVLRYSIISVISLFIDTKALESIYPNRSSFARLTYDRVLTEGIQKRVIIAHPFMTSGKQRDCHGGVSDVSGLSQSIRTTLRNTLHPMEVAVKQPRPSSNGLLHLAIVSQTQSDTFDKVVALLEEVYVWRQLQEEFDDEQNGAKITYIRIRPEQHVGWKWGALGDVMSFIHSGSPQATNYGGCISVNGKHYRALGETCFGGDELVAHLAAGDLSSLSRTGSRFNSQQLLELRFLCEHRWKLHRKPVLRNPGEVQAYISGMTGASLYCKADVDDVSFITMDDRDTIEPGSFWEWAAQMECVPSWVDASTPSLTVRNAHASNLTRFQCLGESLFQPTQAGLLWIMERQQTAGKTWFRVASYVNKVHGTEILSPMIHTSHDQMESKALNCIRLPSVKCADTRVETCDEWKAQIQRFLYGDLAVWQSAWIDNNWLIRGYRYFMRLPQGLYAARSYAEYLILLNPSDFAFTDVDFLVYLIVTLLVPGRPPNWLQPYVVYTIVGTSVIIIPLFIAPVVFHAKAKGLSLITTLSSLLASISLLLQSSFIVLPLVVLKPIMFVKCWVSYRLPETLHKRPTGWTKKAPGLWADLFVSACGLFLMACLSQWWAFSNMFTFVLCQPISLPWLLWGVLTKPLFLGTTSRKEEKDEEKLIVDLSLRDRIL